MEEVLPPDQLARWHGRDVVGLMESGGGTREG